MRDDDSQEIKRLLTESLEAVLDCYFPAWIAGRGGRSAYPIPGAGADKGSMEVYLAPCGRDQRGSWYRRSEGIGGDVVSLISYAITGNTHSYREAFSEARRFLGIRQDPKREHIKRVIKHLDKSKLDMERVERSIEFRKKVAREIWDKSKPIMGTLAEGYLVNRGINFDLTAFDSLRYTELVYPYRDAATPAVKYGVLVAAVKNVAGEVTAIWRIFLEEDNGRIIKARVPKPKLGLGSAVGGAVWLGNPGETIWFQKQCECVNACEGIETGLGIVGLTGGQTVAACLSTGGLVGFRPPPNVRRLLIWPDSDSQKIQFSKIGKTLRPSPGLEAAMGLVERLKGQLNISVQKTPQNGKDWLDYWNDAVAASNKFGSDEAS